MLQILNEQSQLVGDRPDLRDDQLLDLYSGMVLIRTLDRKFTNLNLQGRMSSYYKMEGQDAQFAAGMAMSDKDWLVPAYRDMGAWHAKGMELETIVRLWLGAQDYKWDVESTRITNVCGTIGTQMPHGTGIGYTAKIENRDEVGVRLPDQRLGDRSQNPGVNVRGPGSQQQPTWQGRAMHSRIILPISKNMALSWLWFPGSAGSTAPVESIALHIGSSGPGKSPRA